jgi:hypothetical protein
MPQLPGPPLGQCVWCRSCAGRVREAHRVCSLHGVRPACQLLPICTPPRLPSHTHAHGPCRWVARAIGGGRPDAIGVELGLPAGLGRDGAVSRGPQGLVALCDSHVHGCIAAAPAHDRQMSCSSGSALLSSTAVGPCPRVAGSCDSTVGPGMTCATSLSQLVRLHALAVPPCALPHA